MDPDKPEQIMLSPVCWPASGGPKQTLIFRNQPPDKTFNNTDLNIFLYNIFSYLYNFRGFSTSSAMSYDVL
jgi:hypothetical protein